MSYTELTLIDTDVSAAGTPLVIANCARLLLQITLQGTGSLIVQARSSESGWRELATFTASGEFTLDNYGWQELRVVASLEGANPYAHASLSWSR